MGDFLAHLGQTNRPRCCRGGGARVLLLGQESTCRTGRWRSSSSSAALPRRACRSRGRGVKLLGEVPQGLPALGLPAVQLARRRRTAAAGPRLLPARRGRDRGDRPHVRREARLSVRHQPGVPRPGRREPRRWPRRGLPGQRRHVAVAGQRERRRAHAALGAGRRGADAGGRALLLGHCCATCRSRCWPRSCSWRWPVCSRSRRCSASGALHRGEFVVAMAALLGVLGAGPAPGRPDRGGHLAGPADPPRLAAARRLPRSHPRHAPLLRPRARTRQRADPRRARVPRRGLAPLLQRRHVFDAVLARVDAVAEPLRLVVCDLSTSPYVDLAGARMLVDAERELERRGIALRIVEARSSVRDMLRAEGVEAKAGPIARGVSSATRSPSRPGQSFDTAQVTTVDADCWRVC